MAKPKFEVDPALEGIYKELSEKELKPEFGNPKHIAAVRYHENKQEFIKKLKRWCEDNSVDFEFEFEKIFGAKELYFDVEVYYRGTENYTIKARNADEAREKAEDEFSSETIGSLNPSITVSVR